MLTLFRGDVSLLAPLDITRRIGQEDVLINALGKSLLII
jgi:hypothetical protein